MDQAMGTTVLTGMIGVTFLVSFLMPERFDAPKEIAPKVLYDSAPSTR